MFYLSQIVKTFHSMKFSEEKKKLKDKKTKNYVETRLKCEINQLLLMSKDSGKREAYFLFQAQIHTHR